MTLFFAIPILVFASVLSPGAFAQSKEVPPEWAYLVNPPGLKPTPDQRW